MQFLSQHTTDSMETISSFDIPATPEHCRNSEGAFLTLNSGRVIFLYTQYEAGIGEDHDRANIVQIHSDDDGDSWHEDGIVFNRGNAQNIMSVSLLKLKSGRIIALFVKKFRADDGLMHCIPQIATSDDDANTWSEPKPIFQHFGYHVINNDRLVQLANGRIAFAEASTIFYKRQDDTGYGPAVCIFTYSDDDGDSWQQSRSMIFPVTGQGSILGWQEPGIIELKPDVILMWLRNDLGYQYLTKSYDNGITWSAPAPGLAFPSPVSPLSMKRDPKDNSLIAIWNDQSPKYGVNLTGETTFRRPFVIARSRDNGLTWSEHQVLENTPQHGYCYTAIHFHKNRTLIAYCCGEHNDSHRLLQDLRIRVLK